MPTDPRTLAYLDQLKAAADEELDDWLEIVGETVDGCHGDEHQAIAVLHSDGALPRAFQEQHERFLNLFMAASLRLAKQPKRGQP